MFLRKTLKLHIEHVRHALRKTPHVGHHRSPYFGTVSRARVFFALRSNVAVIVDLPEVVAICLAHAN